MEKEKQKLNGYGQTPEEAAHARKEQRANWYQKNKVRQNYLRWIRVNPHFKDVKDSFELYKAYGGTRAKRIMMERVFL